MTCLRRRDLLRLKASTAGLTQTRVSRLSHAPLRFLVALTEVVNKRNAILRLLWIVSRLLSGRIIIRVSIDKRVDGKDSARVDVEVRHEHLQ